MNRVISALVTIYFGAQSIGCAATLNNGSSQNVQFASMPSGATVNFGSWKLKTPGSAQLDTRKSYSVRFSAPGYQDEYVSIDRKISGAFWVGLLVWGPFELLSFIDGSAWDLEPYEVFVTMEESPVVPAAEVTPQS